MSKSFDLVVIGTGAGGSTAAHRCRRKGWQVAIVDSRLSAAPALFVAAIPRRSWSEPPR